MTSFEEWKTSSDHFFEWLKYADLFGLPQWKYWEEEMDLTLRSMSPEHARDISMDKLIEITGLKNKIELAVKQANVQRKLDEINEDFN